jgi:glycerophosphoryl diester phosphodiesterase
MIGFCRPPRPWEGVLQLPERAGGLKIVTPSRIQTWQRRGWQVQVWTIDSESDMRRLVNWGVDGIVTNRPSLLDRVLKDMAAEAKL